MIETLHLLHNDHAARVSVAQISVSVKHAKRRIRVCGNRVRGWPVGSITNRICESEQLRAGLTQRTVLPPPSSPHQVLQLLLYHSQLEKKDRDRSGEGVILDCDRTGKASILTAASQ